MPDETAKAVGHDANMQAVAPTMVYDFEAMGSLDGGTIPEDLVRRITVPTLALAGSTSPESSAPPQPVSRELLLNGTYSLLEGGGPVLCEPGRASRAASARRLDTVGRFRAQAPPRSEGSGRGHTRRAAEPSEEPKTATAKRLAIDPEGANARRAETAWDVRPPTAGSTAYLRDTPANQWSGGTRRQGRASSSCPARSRCGTDAVVGGSIEAQVNAVVAEDRGAPKTPLRRSVMSCDAASTLPTSTTAAGWWRRPASQTAAPAWASIYATPTPWVWIFAAELLAGEVLGGT